MMNQIEATAEKRTIIEEGTGFKGSLVSDCPVDVRGRIEGDIEAPSLSVSASGAVHGRAKVGSIRSEGELAGEFDADRLELAGSVRDNTVIRARCLEVKLAASRGKLSVIFGECELSVGDEPTEHDLVSDVAEAKSAVTTVDEAAQAREPEAGTVDEAAQASEPEAGTVDEAAQAREPEAGTVGEAVQAAEPAQSSVDDPPSAGQLFDGLEAEPARGATGTKRQKKQKNGSGDSVPPGWSQPPSNSPAG